MTGAPRSGATHGGAPEPRVQVVGPLATAHLFWCSRGQLHLTVVARSTFALVPGGVMTAQAPEPILGPGRLDGGEDVLERLAADLVPYLTRADVIVVGAPAAPGTLPSRLAVLRDGHPLVDKALGGGGEHLDEPPATLGLVPRSAPSRQRLLPTGLSPERVDVLAAGIVEVPEGFDWAFFQSAPPDQQTAYLRGDERVVLEGAAAAGERIDTRLPGIAALGRLGGFRGGDDAWLPIGLRADVLCLDPARRRATLTWRATVPVHDPARMGELRIQLLSSRAAETAWWPDWDDDDTATQGAGLVGAAALPAAHVALPTELAARSPGPRSAGGTLVLEAPAARDRRALSTAPTMLIVDEPTIEADPAMVELDLDLVLSQVMSSEAVTQPRAAPTEPRGGRAVLRDAAPVAFVAERPLAGATLAWGWEGRPGAWRTIILKVAADLVHGGAALLRDEPPSVRGDDETLGGGDAAVVRWPSDLAPVKPRVDVVLLGHARAPEGAARAARGEVRFAFGRTADGAPVDGAVGFDRRLRVFGDRTWRDVVGELLPGQPAPFTRIPLTWDRAFGGPGWDVNPAGIGYTPPRTSPERLPNLEWPERPIVHPRDKVKPAGFGPIPPWWAARAALRGKSDDEHQHAPLEQRIDHVEGDEPFVLEGVHATLRRIEGTLPGERARCFAVRDGGALEEVRLRLDAVTFDADELAIELTWRGVLEVGGPDAGDLIAVYGRLEPVGQPPASLDACRDAYRALARSSGPG